MNKILEFPKSKIVRDVPPNIEELEKNKERGKQRFAEDIMDDFVGNMIDALEGYGIETEGDQFMKDFSFTAEALRSTIYRSLGLKHHLHDFTDKCVDMVPSKGGVGMTMQEVDDLIIMNALEKEELDKQ